MTLIIGNQLVEKVKSIFLNTLININIDLNFRQSIVVTHKYGRKLDGRYALGNEQFLWS